MDLKLTVDRSTRKVTAGLSDAAPLTVGDQIVVSLAITQKIGDSVEASDLPVRSLRASIGKTLAPPVSGKFSLASTTIALAPIAIANVSFDATDAAMLAAMAGLLWVTAVAKPADCTWVLTTSRTELQTAPPAFTLTANSLAPQAFVRIRPYIESGFWQVEIRLIIEPLAFTSAHTRVLATEPSVRRIRGGDGSLVNDGIFLNEIQSLTWPLDFLGTITLTFDSRQSSILGQQDGPDKIAAALNALYTDGKIRFAVSNPVNNEAYVEFIGDLESSPQNLITVTVKTFEPGALTFTLDLKRAPAFSAFRGVDAKGLPITSLVLPFEISAMIVEDGLDPEDMGNVARPFTLLQTAVTVVREQIWDELADVDPINWVNPPQPVSYVPFVANQVVTGQQHYSVVIGDGIASVFDIAHGLATRLLAGPPMVAENADGGEIYAYGLDFTATITNANAVRLTFPSPPDAASLMVTITTAGPKTAFVTGVTFTEAQVVGLLDDLAALGTRLGNIELLVPVPSLLGRAVESVADSFKLPDFKDVWPGRFPAGFSKDSVFGQSFNSGTMPRPRWLFPAIHDAVTESAALPLGDPADSGGRVFVNDSADPLEIAGAGGLLTILVPVGGFYGSDGRAWIALTRVGDTSSYHPTGYERDLFILPVAEQQFRAGRNLTISAKLTPSLVRSTTRMKAFLSVEIGIPVSQASPGTPAENLEGITWDATPVLLHPILLTANALEIPFGITVLRATGGALTSEQTLYGQTVAGGVAPGVPTFFVRGRLLRFDTENNVANATGYLAAKCEEITVTIS